MTVPATDELIAEIKAGLKGVTPGPWLASKSDTAKGCPSVVADGGPMGCAQVAIFPSEFVARVSNAAHVARCSPDNLAAVLLRLEVAEKENQALREAAKGQLVVVNQAKEAIARAEKAEAALKEATEWRPMETAPKDGTEVRLCDADGNFSAWFVDGDWWFYGQRDGDFAADPVSESRKSSPAGWLPLPEGGQ